MNRKWVNDQVSPSSFRSCRCASGCYCSPNACAISCSANRPRSTRCCLSFCAASSRRCERTVPVSGPGHGSARRAFCTASVRHSTPPVHFHCCVLDGVFEAEPASGGQVRFSEAVGLSAQELAAVQAQVRRPHPTAARARSSLSRGAGAELASPLRAAVTALARAPAATPAQPASAEPVGGATHYRSPARYLPRLATVRGEKCGLEHDSHHRGENDTGSQELEDDIFGIHGFSPFPVLFIGTERRFFTMRKAGSSVSCPRAWRVEGTRTNV